MRKSSYVNPDTDSKDECAILAFLNRPLGLFRITEVKVEKSHAACNS